MLKYNTWYNNRVEMGYFAEFGFGDNCTSPLIMYPVKGTPLIIRSFTFYHAVTIRGVAARYIDFESRILRP